MRVMEGYDDISSFFLWNETDFKVHEPTDIMLLTLAVFGAILNILHVFVMIRLSKRKRTSVAPHSIAVGITIILCLSVCFISREVFPNFVIEESVVCRMYNFLEIVSQCMVISMLVLISVDNYCVVIMTSRGQTFISRHFCVILVCSLITSSIIGLPFLIEEFNDVTICGGLALDSTFAKCYEIIRGCFTYIIPLVVIAVVHVKMSCALVRSERTIAMGSFHGRHNSNIASRRRLRVAILLLAFLFSICYLPTTLAFILIQYDLQIGPEMKFTNVLYNSHVYFMLCYMILHPLILMTSTQSVHRELRYLCCPYHVFKLRQQKQPIAKV
ncbi:uncharacterized protein [Antedon mediterranea]|uniref:uncharacterized protein n=1 Tax=Antedon mediterranea TaxID=105859 RepID=UPI003AF5083C